MSNEKANKKTEEAVKPVVSAAKSVKKETEFHLHELREHSRELFGIKPEVFDGAFFNFQKSSTTKREATKLIQSYLKKEVK